MTFAASVAADRVLQLEPWHPSLGEFIAATFATWFTAALCGDWIAGAAVLVLWFVWRLLQPKEGPPVLGMALAFQWTQVTLGMFYMGVIGRELPTMRVPQYRTMILLGLGCVLSLGIGLFVGARLLGRRSRPAAGQLPISMKSLLIAYAASLVLQGAVTEFAWQIPDLTQAILAIGFVHLALLFVIIRRLVRPVFEWHWIAALMINELLLGFTGFFAGFRDPLVLAGIVLIEVFDARKLRHWISLTVVVVAGSLMAVMWMGIRGEYRSEFYTDLVGKSRQARLDRIAELSSTWLSSENWMMAHDMDRLVDRMWTIYYPAVALGRVPSVLPYTHGRFISEAVTHVLSPRIFYPTKAALQSDSDNVRKYTGLFVAGAEQNTSIAFGYAIESYIDFGVPWMFAPVFVFGLVMGLVYEGLSRLLRIQELRVGIVALIFWLILYLFERSWVKTLGLAGTLIVYLGVPTFIIDKYVRRRFADRLWSALDSDRRTDYDVEFTAG